MNSIKLKAYAKINLSLDILRKRPDGYHEVKMLMQRINLHDDINLKIVDKGTNLVTNVSYLPINGENIVYKVADEFIKHNKINKGIDINLIKRIPIGSGLGGGSADAAATLIGLNMLFECRLSKQDLMNFAVRFGTDIPFCILGGTALAEGIGEKLTELPSIDLKNILICKPIEQISTAYVYKNFKFEKVNKRPHIELLVSSIRNKNYDILARNMVNVLETVTANKYTEINTIKTIMMQSGAQGSIMTGSGTSVFGIFPNRYSLCVAADALSKYSKEIFVTQTVNC